MEMDIKIPFLGATKYSIRIETGSQLKSITQITWNDQQFNKNRNNIETKD